jgi:hypothetical protein
MCGTTARNVHAGQVDGQHVVPLRLGQLGHGPEAADAGVGDHDVELAELVERLGDDALHRGTVADVGLDGHRPPAELLDELHSLGEVVLVGQPVRHRRDVGTQVGQHHVGAGGGQRQRVRTSLAATRAGDESDPSVELVHHRLLSLRPSRRQARPSLGERRSRETPGVRGTNSPVGSAALMRLDRLNQRVNVRGRLTENSSRAGRLSAKPARPRPSTRCLCERNRHIVSIPITQASCSVAPQCGAVPSEHRLSERSE